MTYILLIRYKDGREKLIELDVAHHPLQFPYMSTESVPITGGQYSLPTYKTVNTLVDVLPYQTIRDRHGGTHTICINEILDITIEATA